MTAPIKTAQPQLCFGQVLHERLLPIQHRFAYRVFFLRLPLRAIARQPSLLQVSAWLSYNRFNLLSYFDSDHGDQAGIGQHGLPWLDTLLAQHGIEDADGEVWLHTFPRVLGYVFNPVSFWFCERRDGSLRAVVCEVNNTFGERHIYLLEHAKGVAWGSELSANKVFHVSPFNEVQGDYRFKFVRRLPPEKAENVADQLGHYLSCVDYETASGLTLKTSIAGRAEPLSKPAVRRALLSYPMMTIGVVLRIHWQALQLWWKGQPFHRKPVPPLTPVTHSLPDEVVLEKPAVALNNQFINHIENPNNCFLDGRSKKPFLPAGLSEGNCIGSNHLPRRHTSQFEK